jgi:Asp-tRNA(Asn)/Glu-tRNA(Gln) amidotransferase A subunit family amidase
MVSTWDGSLTIGDLQKAYSTSSVSVTEVVEEVYRRIEAYHDKAVWISLVPLEEVKAAALALEERYRGKEKPALYGVPFSVKNSIDVKGHPTTLACPSFAYTPEENAPVVRRILEAGGVLIGCTNLDRMHQTPFRRRTSVTLIKCFQNSLPV